MIKGDDIVLCTVTRIEGTTVFVSVEGSNTTGTITFSEIAPGRIRNIREYVVVNKKIVCKVLRVLGDHAELSLRRVASGERDAVMQAYKQELVLTKVLKPVVKEPSQVIEKIKEKYNIVNFLDEARQTPSLWEKVLGKKEAQELQSMIGEKVESEKEAKAEIKISSHAESGLEDIKRALEIKNVDIRYLGSSRFSLVVKAKDYKTANHSLEAVLETIKSNAKKHGAKLEIKER